MKTTVLVLLLLLSLTTVLFSGLKTLFFGVRLVFSKPWEGAVALDLEIDTERAVEREMSRRNLDASQRSAIVETTLRQSAETMRRRLVAFGVDRPWLVTDLPSRRIRVEMPGVRDPERVASLLEETGWLEMKLVREGPASHAELRARLEGDRLPGMEVACTRGSGASRPEPVEELCYLVASEPVITGADLEWARPNIGEFDQPVVFVRLTTAAGEAFRRVTAANQGKYLAILLDGRVLTAPMIRGEIAREAVIEGSFTEQEVDDLVVMLRSGGMPAPARVIATEPISGARWIRFYLFAIPAAGILLLVSAALAFTVIVKLVSAPRTPLAPPSRHTS